MKFKVLGAVLALFAVSVVFAQMVVTRVNARGYATNSSSQRLDFQFSAVRMQSGSNTRYIGGGNFRWRSGTNLYVVTIRRVSSLVATNEGDRVVEMSGIAELSQGGSLLGRRAQRTMGAFTLRLVDYASAEAEDTVEFAFSAGAGLNAVNIDYSGTVQEGSQLNILESTL